LQKLQRPAPKSVAASASAPRIATLGMAPRDRPLNEHTVESVAARFVEPGRMLWVHAGSMSRSDCASREDRRAPRDRVGGRGCAVQHAIRAHGDVEVGTMPAIAVPAVPW
jgi:hypothetical protein